MNDESSDDRPPKSSEGYLVPIVGLLAVLFAVLAGIRASGGLRDSGGWPLR